MTKDELLAEKAELTEQLAIINATIRTVMSRPNKKYLYGNTESTHQAETHSLKELREQKQGILDELARINRLLGCVVLFTQMKN